jgi:hypothetical protein
MLPVDYTRYVEVFPRWKAGLPFECRNICLISPSVEQCDLFAALFPKAKLHILTREIWDLYDRTRASFDLCFAANVFQCSETPEIWFSNVLRSTKRFWIQDVIVCNRGLNSEIFGPPEDKMRFRYAGIVESNFEGAYDLKRWEPAIHEFLPYDAGSGFVHFVADMRGEVPQQAATVVPPLTLGQSWISCRYEWTMRLKRQIKTKAGPFVPLLKAVWLALDATRDRCAAHRYRQ